MAKRHLLQLLIALTPGLLLGGGLVTHFTKHDTNPANNPQAPARYRKK